MRFRSSLVLLVACGGHRTPAASTPAPPTSVSPAPIEIASTAAPPPPPPVVVANEDDAKCERARAAFEIAAAPAIDACVARAGPHRHGPMGARFFVDDAGHVSHEQNVVILTTGYGSKIAFCVVAAVRATPFDERACATRQLTIERAYPF